MTLLSRIFSHCPAMIMAALLGMQALPATAHEFWIEPENWTPTKETKLFGFISAPGKNGLRLKVGTGFRGTAQPDIPNEQRRFDIVAPDLTLSPAGRGFGEDPAGELSVESDGAWRVVFADHGKNIDFSKTDFVDYLEKSGLGPEVAAMEAWPVDKKVHELYLRNAVYLLLRGDAVFPMRPAGLQLELVPLNDPRSLDINEGFELQVLWQGKPLAGRYVYALAEQENGTEIASAYSDQQGRVSLPVGKKGPVLINVIHMERASQSAEPKAGNMDFVSHWMALTVMMP